MPPYGALLVRHTAQYVRTLSSLGSVGYLRRPMATRSRAVPERIAPSLRVEVRPEGVFVPALELFLDPDRPVARAFVSHAHADHDGGFHSEVTIASRETATLLEARRGPTDQSDGRTPSVGRLLRLEWGEACELPIDRAHGGGTAKLSILPAGHILGAAQLVIDHPKGRLVYTGDYRTGTGRTHAEGAPVPCDTLVIESTFGLPIFRWPDRWKTIAEIVTFCRDTLAIGETPVLLAYALGKSQALVHELLATKLSVVAHGAAFKMCAAYEALGCPMGIASGELRAYADEKKLASLGGVLIAPPGTEAQPMIKKRQKIRVGYVSGFAIVDASVERHRADAAFVLSDHADFDDLLATVERTGARYVYTTYGTATPFAAILNARGIVAEPLERRSIDESERSVP